DYSPIGSPQSHSGARFATAGHACGRAIQTTAAEPGGSAWWVHAAVVDAQLCIGSPNRAPPGQSPQTLGRSSAMTAHVRHPLEPLSADEVQQAVDLLKSAGKVTPTTRFVSVSLREPNKALV